MLYITTRSNQDAYTVYRTLCEDCAPDGGQFVPFAQPSFSSDEIAELKEKSFGQIVAELLNSFYGTKLTGWDVDFTIGRNAAKLIPMNHRMVIAELWHNPGSALPYTISSLYNKICNNDPPAKVPTKWFVISVRIAVLFGIYGQMLRSGSISADQSFDVCVADSDLSEFLAAWYARSYGLPVEKIVCAVGDDSALWDFIHRGVCQPSCLPLFDIERLIYGTLGSEEVIRFLSMQENGRIYSLDEDLLPLLNSGLYCCVTSKERITSTINSLFRSNRYIADENTAFCYGGLQDYRAKTGESNLTLLLAEKTPLYNAAAISLATGIAEDKLVRYINIPD